MFAANNPRAVERDWKMSNRTDAKRMLTYWLIGIALVLPTVSLIPLGTLWLLQNGWLLYWAIAAVTLASTTYLLERHLLGPGIDQARAAAEQLEDELSGELPTREASAWRRVRSIAGALDPASLSSWGAVLDLGMKTVRAVAEEFHPKLDDPLLRFTMPEALLIVEQASARLRLFIVGSIPLGDQITVRRLALIYRWRGAIDYFVRAYDIWRLVRFANPASAATQEARERLSGHLVRIGRDQLAKRLAAAYVEEVGRAAIDLYSGRSRGAMLAADPKDAGITAENRSTKQRFT